MGAYFWDGRVVGKASAKQLGDPAKFASCEAYCGMSGQEASHKKTQRKTTLDNTTTTTLALGHKHQCNLSKT